MRRFIIISGILCLAAVFPLFGLDLPVYRIPDDSPLRVRMKENWLTESPARVLARSPSMQNLEGGGRVEVRTESDATEFRIIFARELMGGRVPDSGVPAASGGALNSASGRFPGWAQGSWVLSRRKDSGAAVRIRVFLRSDPYTYIQFRPFSTDKCQMDVALYDAYVVHSLSLPVPFERLYTMPINDILNLAGAKFPIRYFEVDPRDYGEQRRFVAAVRQHLGGLRFADDGALDENGRYVLIDSLQSQGEGGGLNCSGFAKWLIDGMLKPVTGKRLAVAPLKTPFGGRGSSITEPWEASRDPFFGLDWIRNLASEAGTVLRSPVYGVLDEFEVRAEPFSLIIKRGARSSVINAYSGFLEGAGYASEGIQPLLYTLAIDDPGAFYLAAVNNEVRSAITAENPRGLPRLRQYYHIAALVPYFNEYGVFQVAVFESAAETSFSNFKNRYPGQSLNLVRIPVETKFDP